MTLTGVTECIGYIERLITLRKKIFDFLDKKNQAGYALTLWEK